MDLQLSNYDGTGGPAVFEEKERTQDSYQGAERRRQHRRGGPDRRLEMRFEPNKVDRRVCAGRRADDQKAKIW